MDYKLTKEAAEQLNLHIIRALRELRDQKYYKIHESDALLQSAHDRYKCCGGNALYNEVVSFSIVGSLKEKEDIIDRYVNELVEHFSTSGRNEAFAKQYLTKEDALRDAKGALADANLLHESAQKLLSESTIAIDKARDRLKSMEILTS